MFDYSAPDTILFQLKSMIDEQAKTESDFHSKIVELSKIDKVNFNKIVSYLLNQNYDKFTNEEFFLNISQDVDLIASVAKKIEVLSGTFNLFLATFISRQSEEEVLSALEKIAKFYSETKTDFVKDLLTLSIVLVMLGKVLEDDLSQLKFVKKDAFFTKSGFSLESASKYKEQMELSKPRKNSFAHLKLFSSDNDQYKRQDVSSQTTAQIPSYETLILATMQHICKMELKLKEVLKQVETWLESDKTNLRLQNLQHNLATALKKIKTQVSHFNETINTLEPALLTRQHCAQLRAKLQSNSHLAETINNIYGIHLLYKRLTIIKIAEFLIIADPDKRKQVKLDYSLLLASQTKQITLEELQQLKNANAVLLQSRSNNAQETAEAYLQILQVSELNSKQLLEEIEAINLKNTDYSIKLWEILAPEKLAKKLTQGSVQTVALPTKSLETKQQQRPLPPIPSVKPAPSVKPIRPPRPIPLPSPNPSQNTLPSRPAAKNPPARPPRPTLQLAQNQRELQKLTSSSENKSRTPSSLDFWKTLEQKNEETKPSKITKEISNPLRTPNNITY